MIAFLRGTVAAVAPDGVVLDVGGVGYSVQCTPGTLANLRVGEAATVPTSLLVREDSLTLYGFADEDERVVFELLQTASGVGPRLAQAMLAVHPPDELRRAVAAEDLVSLMRVPGIGRKGAQRIVLELKDRLGSLVGPHAPATGSRTTPGSWREQVHGALVGLGYSVREADDALAALSSDPATKVASPDVGALLRAALANLARS